MKLSDNVAYRRATEQLGKLQGQLRDMQVEREQLADQLRTSKSGGLEDQAAALLEGNLAVDSGSLAEQIQEIDQTLPIYQKAVQLAEAELGKIIDTISPSACSEARPQFVAEIKKIIAALSTIENANGKITELRDGLIRDGARTGSLPYCLFDLGGRFDAIAEGYAESVKRDYPEVRG